MTQTFRPQAFWTFGEDKATFGQVGATFGRIGHPQQVKRSSGTPKIKVKRKMVR